MLQNQYVWYLRDPYHWKGGGSFRLPASSVWDAAIIDRFSRIGKQCEEGW